MAPFRAHLESIIANPSPEHAGFQQMAKDFVEFVDAGIVPQHTDNWQQRDVALRCAAALKLGGSLQSLG